MDQIKIVILGNIKYMVYNGRYIPIIPSQMNIHFGKPISLYKMLKRFSERAQNVTVQELYSFINIRSKTSYSPEYSIHWSNDFLPIARILKQHHSEYIQMFINSFFSLYCPKDFNPNNPTYLKSFDPNKPHLFLEDIERMPEDLAILFPLPKDFLRGGLTQ